MNKYSSLYEYDELNTNRIYRGPSCDTVGNAVTTVCSYAVTVADPFTTDDVLIIKPMNPNEKVVNISIVQSGDADTDNDFTFNLGYTSDPDRLAAASTGLQAGTAVELDHSTTAGLAPAVAGDNLILSRVAGELEAAATLAIVVETVIV